MHNAKNIVGEVQTARKPAKVLIYEGLAAAFMMFGAIGFAFTILPWSTPILDPSDFGEGKALATQTVVGTLITAFLLYSAFRMNRNAQKYRYGPDSRDKFLPDKDSDNLQ